MPKNQMLINVVAGEECRIAIIADGRLEELYQERASAESHVGNIYKGRVTNVEPSIQAAFVDFGQERNGFLHISDLHPMYFAGHDKDETEMVGQKTPRRDRPPIQKCLRRGQEILVQVLKEGIGTKGPTLTSYLSIPGRYLVMMPSMERLGVSRKVEDDDARREMRRILDELKPPQGFGFIIRTAGIGKNKTELKRDLAYLQRLWSSIEQRKKHVNVGELFAESDLVVRTIRDIFSTDIEQIIVDDEPAAKRARDFLAIANPRTSSKVALYNDPIPLFHRFDIERQIETISSRTVPLPSGGSLVIDSTEALVAIDVNSGKMRDARDAEGTAFKANMEAADEICRQLRLRDLGGVIVSDLIDMRDLRHRRQVETRFRDNLKRDRARTRTSPISQFGILEMTRQRMRPSLRKSLYIDCPHCEGAAQVKSPESVVLDVTRRLALVMHRNNVARVELTVSPAVAFALLNKKRSQLVALETQHAKTIMVRVNDSGPGDFVSLLAFDERGSQVEGESLANMGAYELVPVEAVKGKVIVNREEAEPIGVQDEDSDFESADRSGNYDNNDNEDSDNASESDESNADREQGSHDGNQDENGERQQRDNEEGSNSQENQDGEQGGKKRKRRRRRGGRGRNKRTADQTDADAESSQNSDEQSVNQINADQDRNDQQVNETRDQNIQRDDRDQHAGDDTKDEDRSGNDQPKSPRGGAQLAGLSKKLQQEQQGTPDENDAADDANQHARNEAGNQDMQDQKGQQDSQKNRQQDQDDASMQGDGEQEPGVKKRRRRRRGGRRRSGSGGGSNSGENSESGENSQNDNQSDAQGNTRQDASEHSQKEQQNQQGQQDNQGNRSTGGSRSSNKAVESDSGSPKSEPVVSRGYHNPALKPSGSSDQA